MRVIDRRNTFLAALAAPLATGYFFYFGFFNFCLGTALFLFTVGNFLSRRPTWTAGRTAAMLGLLLLTVSAHLLPFGMAAIVLTLIVLLDAGRALRLDRAGGDAPRRLPTVVRRQALPVAAALTVPSALTLLFLFRSDNVQGVGLDPDAPDTSSSALSVRQLLRATIGQVTVYNRQEVALGLLLFAVFGVLAVLAVRGVLAARRSSAGAPALLVPLVLMVGFCAGLYLFFPNSVGTLTLIRPRFGLFAILFALLALATVRYSRRAAPATLAVVLVVAVGLPVARWGRRAP